MLIKKKLPLLVAFLAGIITLPVSAEAENGQSIQSTDRSVFGMLLTSGCYGKLGVNSTQYSKNNRILNMKVQKCIYTESEKLKEKVVSTSWVKNIPEDRLFKKLIIEAAEFAITNNPELKEHDADTLIRNTKALLIPLSKEEKEKLIN